MNRGRIDGRRVNNLYLYDLGEEIGMQLSRTGTIPITRIMWAGHLVRVAEGDYQGEQRRTAETVMQYKN